MTWNEESSHVESEDTYVNQAEQGLTNLLNHSLPDMYGLQEELRAITRENEVSKQKERDRLMFQSMERLFDEIVNQKAIENMRVSAEDGYDQSIIYKFPHQGEWEGYPIMFLLKGPMVDRGSGVGEDYFKNRGDVSLLERLRIALHPFKVKHRFNRLRQENLIVVYW